MLPHIRGQYLQHLLLQSDKMLTLFQFSFQLSQKLFLVGTSSSLTCMNTVILKGFPVNTRYSLLRSDNISQIALKCV